MISNSAITHLLESEYGVELLAVEPFGPENPDRQAYRIATSTGKQWLARLHRSAAPAPMWLPVADSATWMLQQAAMLEWCERHAYPAPRLLPTLAGTPLAQLDGWSAIMTEYIQGEAIQPTTPAWRRLGEMLGQLHELGSKADRTEIESLPYSWWAPIESAAARVQSLLACVSSVPDEWIALFESCHSILQEIDVLRTLTDTIVHGDPWTGNVVARSSIESVWIDWEYAGRGLAVLDLACLLNECYRNPDHSMEIDDSRVRAVIHGYTSAHSLTPAEQDALPDAIRYEAAFLAGIRFHLTQTKGWNGSISKGLQREQKRIERSDQLASVVLRLIK